MDVAHLIAETEGAPTRFELATGQTATMGRSSRCTFRIRDRSVSRLHCELQLVGGRLLVRDLGSTQGIVHRGVQYERLELDVGDDFLIGNCNVRFDMLAMDAPPPEPERPAASGANAALGANTGPTNTGPTNTGHTNTGHTALAAPVAPPRAPRPAVGSGEPLRVVRRPPPPGKALAARLAAETIVFAITAAIVVAMLVLLKIAAGFDLYEAFRWMPGMQGR